MSDSLTPYTFPLAPGRWAHLKLPPDLTPREVDRIVAFLRALVVPEDTPP